MKPSKCKFKSLIKLIPFTLKLSELQSLRKDKETDGVFQTMHPFDPFSSMKKKYLKFSILDFITHGKTWKCNYSLFINNYPPTLAPS